MQTVPQGLLADVIQSASDQGKYVAVWRQYFHYWPARFVILSWPLGVSIAYTALYAVLTPIANTIPSSPSLTWVAFAGVVEALKTLAMFRILIPWMSSLGGLTFLRSYALERRRQRLYPEAVGTLQLLSILTRVTRHPTAWGSLEMKHELVARLERVANSLHDDLPRRLASDIATDGRVQRMAEPEGCSPARHLGTDRRTLTPAWVPNHTPWET